MTSFRRISLPAMVVISLALLDAQSPTPSASRTAPPAAAPADVVGVLYNQLDNPTTSNVVSQDFETDFDTFDNQTADDFTVPAGTFWRIVEVDVDGEYFNGAGPAASVNVTFYSNGGGSLPGVVQCARPASPFGGATGDFVVTLSSPCVLGPGVHWVSVQTRQDFGTAGEWGWHNRTVQAGSGAAWINPGNGFGSGCTSWGRKTTCLPTQDGPDQMFRLVGDLQPMVQGDFDADGKTDYTVLRFPSGPITWYMLGSVFAAFPWGNVNSGTGFVYTGDFDGDFKADPVVCDNNPRICYVRRSSNGSLLALQWGSSGDVSNVPGDYDGDGRTDFSVFRPGNGTWYVNRSSDGSLLAGAFGLSGDHPAPGDYDADGRTDFAVFRPSTGTFYLQQSTAGFSAIPWGTSGDIVVCGDFDGDGKADPAVVRGSGGNFVFYVRQSSNGALLAAQWGLTSDTIAVGDYDGDKKTDFAVWRSGVFYVRKSSNGALLSQAWGQSGDYAAMSAFSH